MVSANICIFRLPGSDIAIKSLLDVTDDSFYLLNDFSFEFFLAED
jgi:hypothetical protein